MHVFRRLASLLLLPFTFAACARATTSSDAVVVTVAPVPVASVVTPPEPAVKPPEPPANTPSSHKVALTLKPGEPACTLVLDGVLFQDHPEWFVIASVSRIATENSGGCAAAVVYDLSKETQSDPNAMPPEELAAGIFKKPGQTLTADMADEPVWNVTDDLDFDDVADLCVVALTGAYNYSQKCWLFDTQSRTFVRHDELDNLIFMKIDRKKKKLTSAFRAGGPVYENNEYEWQNGSLVKIFQSVSYFGEKPDGTPLPTGFSHWLIRYEPRGGKLVKTFEGPLRDPP